MSTKIEIPSQGRAIVQFGRTDCPHCTAVMEFVRNEARNDFAIFMNVDIEENYELADKYKVRMLPTIMIFQDGEMQLEIEGSSLKQISRMIQRTSNA